MIDINVTLEQINKRSLTNMAEHLGLEFVEIHPDYLVAKLPVDYRTTQPLGMLNGGASAALAETVGSMAAYLSVDRNHFYTLGLEIKVNHLRPAIQGYVYGKATPIHIGRKTHVWKIETRDDEGNLISYSTLTMAVVAIEDFMRDKIHALTFEG
jgi:1,4-dihydroxy-2-naphthoyl-CoA hydrolase